jgi:hypothetical protein
MHTVETDYTSSSDVPGLGSARKFKLLDRIATRRGGLLLGALALVLTLPALRLGFMADDHAFPAKFRRGDGPLVVYSVSAADIADSRERGMYPWWTSPNLQARFFRPLTALTHELDFRAWPNAPWLMHLENGLLYALLVLVAWRLYRELLPAEPTLAALAALMFAIDDGHATAAGWIACRSMLLSSLLALASVLAFVRSRASPRSALLRLTGVGCFALSLAAAESGLAALAYLGAYVLTFQQGSLVRRVSRLLPELGVFAVWALMYLSGHYGVRGVSFYRELSSPLSTLAEGVMDLPAWLFILLGPNLLDSVMMQALDVARVAAALLCLPLLAALYTALPRTREVRFFALGALFCLPPMFATLPQDRLLIMASFGAFGVLASFVVAVAKQEKPPRWLRATRGVLFALHLVIAPLLFVPALGQMQLIDRAAERVAAALPAAPARQVVLLNTPVELMTLYAWQRMLEERGRKLPDTFSQLYAGSSRLVVRRVDPYTLELRPAHGWGRVPIERVFCKLADLPRAGTSWTVSGMNIRVEQSGPDGRPMRVSFRFPTPLEAAGRLWLVWQGTRPVPWQPPPLGEQVTLGSLSLLNLFEL